MKKKISRKNFIKKLTFGAISTPLIINQISCENEAIANKNNTTKCSVPTEEATAGPFYVENIPESVNINDKNLNGTFMKITGKVLNENEDSIKGAKVEIWHSDSEGAYHPEGSGDVSRYETSEITLRGTTFTNDKGEFSFNSIKPGLYTGRRRHIHWRISESSYQEVITQTYWLSEKGDERESIDFTDRNADVCRYIEFNETEKGIEGNIKFYLEK